MTRALIIAAPRSGAGKTTVTLALLEAFKRKGLRVRAAKNGPDYIDPQFHEEVTGAPCLNLDSWAMSPEMLQSLLMKSSEDADLILIEASMGLFDGLDAPLGQRGSVADLASRLNLPVMLVMDVTGQGQSAAMVASGFADWCPDIKIAGVWFNRIASDRHLALCRSDLRLDLLGVTKRCTGLTMPQRHLGLVQPSEYASWRHAITDLATNLSETTNLDALLSKATSIGPPSRPKVAHKHVHRFGLPAPPGQKIAVARDAAFSFLYPHLMQAWRDAGAEIRFFSPLQDVAPPDDCDACWLPGGYPELYAEQLAACANFKAGMHRFASTRFIHGECGGYMVLGRSIDDAKGQSHEMLGLLSHRTSFVRRKMTLGYRHAQLCAHSALGPIHAVCRGHEFHYARLTDAGTDAPLAAIRDGAGVDLGFAGGHRARVSGSFFHLMSTQLHRDEELTPPRRGLMTCS